MVFYKAFRFGTPDDQGDLSESIVGSTDYHVPRQDLLASQNAPEVKPREAIPYK